MADLQGRIPLTAPTMVTRHHPPLHTQQLISDHNPPSNLRQDKRVVPDEDQLRLAAHETGAVTSVSENMPRPAGVTTKLYSPFPEAGAAESYMSEESESQDESEEEEEEEDKGAMYQSQEGGGVGHAHIQNRMRHVKDHFETSPEPHSLQSSVTENIMKRPKNILRQQQARSRPTRSQRHRNRQNVPHPLVQARYYDDPETQGTFTSAPPTPVSQQRVLVMGSESNDGRKMRYDRESQSHSDDEEEVRAHFSGGQLSSHFNDREVGSHSSTREVVFHSNADRVVSHSNSIGGDENSHSNGGDLEFHSEAQKGEQSSDEFDSEGEKATDEETVSQTQNEQHEAVITNRVEPLEEANQHSETLTPPIPQSDSAGRLDQDMEQKDASCSPSLPEQQQQQEGALIQEDGTDDNGMGGDMAGDEMVLQMS